METNLIPEVIVWLFMGMGIVFATFIILVFITQGKILRNIIPQEKVVETQQIINVVIQPDVSEAVQNVGVNTDAAKIAAIIAAVQHHKNLKG